MRRIAISWLILCAALFAAWQMQTPASAQCNAMMGVLNCSPPPSGTSCSQATTFLARTSGLSGTESTAYTTMICGMVTDGTWSLFDALYIFATHNTTTANLNLVSTSFGLTVNGTCTFTADTGYTGDGSTCYLNTGYTPSTSGGNMTLNSGHVGVCILTNRTSFASYIQIGSYDGTNDTEIEALDGDGNSFFGLNDGSFASNAGVSNVQGNWTVSRTASTGYTVYLNGSSLTAPSVTSVGLPAQPIYLSALNNSGTAGFFSADQLGAAFSGGGLTSGQASNIYSRIHAFLTAVGAPSGC